ncbi:MAG: hypothetical protein ACR2QE_19995 [Acidimicrobiales bacterium]
MTWRTHLGFLLAAVLVAAVVCTFCSWGVSGSVGRSSYELVDSSRALGLLDDGLLRFAPAWFGVPFVAAGAVVALASGRAGTAGALGAVLGGVLISGWLIVKSSPLEVDTAATVGALLGAVLVLVGSVLLILEGVTRRDEPERSERTRAHGADRARHDDTHTADGATRTASPTPTPTSSSIVGTGNRPD